jgi:hypothetical protein
MGCVVAQLNRMFLEGSATQCDGEHNRLQAKPALVPHFDQVPTRY